MHGIENTPASTLVDPDTEQGIPLLAGRKSRESTPLPWLQLAVVCFARFAEANAYNQIFPCAGQMIEDLRIAGPSEVGHYFGLISGVSALVQIFTMYRWGKLSDRLGRKPVMIIGLTGVALSSFTFGLSTSWQLVLARALAGVLSGNIGVAQAILGDITDDTNSMKAFPLLSVAWGIGSIVGPLIGGMLSHPFDRYPVIFGGIMLLDDYPFSLPCIVSSFISGAAIICISLFLNESAPHKTGTTPQPCSHDGNDNKLKTTYGTISPSELTTLEHPSSQNLLHNKNVILLVCTEFLLYFVDFGYETVFVLWAYAPVALGGLGRLPSEIGSALSISATVGLTLPTFLLPKLHNHWDTPTLYTAFLSIWPVIFFLTSLLSIIARNLVQSVGSAGSFSVLWVGVGVILFLMRFAWLGQAAGYLMAKRVAPDAESLGAMFGLAQTAACVGEAIGPAFVSSLFALSVKENLVGGHFVWILMVVISVVGVVVSSRLRILSRR